MNVMKDISVFFSNSQKRLLLLHAQINDKCSYFSHSRLKRHCSLRWIENHDAVFVFEELYLAVVDSLDQLSESRDGEVVERLCHILKRLQHMGFWLAKKLLMLY